MNSYVIHVHAMEVSIDRNSGEMTSDSDQFSCYEPDKNNSLDMRKISGGTLVLKAKWDSGEPNTVAVIVLAKIIESR